MLCSDTFILQNTLRILRFSTLTVHMKPCTKQESGICKRELFGYKVEVLVFRYRTAENCT